METLVQVGAIVVMILVAATVIHLVNAQTVGKQAAPHLVHHKSEHHLGPLPRETPHPDPVAPPPDRLEREHEEREEAYEQYGYPEHYHGERRSEE
ncbi:hypothetical protein [Streptomyces sulphureus]|uniref:hypothetical protein n=1 Tax=Streptomyces sulphureus TaxID=47758 RepID=UPI00036597DC|nr:hypothetical protein [Streptomyces sulphureus]